MDKVLRDAFPVGSMLIWDVEDDPPVFEGTTMLWRGFANQKNKDIISIPQLVEENGDELRAEYLSWVYQLGEAEINGQRMIDRLEIRPGLSYWWFTWMSLKSTFRSPGIYHTLRLFALIHWLEDKKPRSVVLVSQQKTLAEVFRNWCKVEGIKFTFRQPQKNVDSPNGYLYNYIPRPLKAIYKLVSFTVRSRAFKEKQLTANSSVTTSFADYFINLHPDAFASGRFMSSYWTTLTALLHRTGTAVNWLHLFVPSNNIPDAAKSLDLARVFNMNGQGLEHHTMIDSRIDTLMFFGIIKDYWRILRGNLFAGGFKRKFQLHGTPINMWPVYRSEWKDNVFGPIAISNIISLYSLERLFSLLPKQRLGFYLHENQDWEMALVYAWKKNGHGLLTGIPHSTVRFWDMRYFYDPRVYHSEKNRLPMPDQLALNGPVAMKAYRDGGYPAEQLVEAEALRYTYLAKSAGELPRTRTITNHPKVLVCGDVMPSATHKMMRWLERAALYLPSDAVYTIKPHPACSISASDYPALKMEITNQPLAEIIAQYDVAFVSNSTSSAVDAYCQHLPVIQFLDGNNVNMSALRGLSGVVYVSNPVELAEALQSLKSIKTI
jgi:surface carbohydrate biosynthesis protein (TIGR04326 family)